MVLLEGQTDKPMKSNGKPINRPTNRAPRPLNSDKEAKAVQWRKNNPFKKCAFEQLDMST